MSTCAKFSYIKICFSFAFTFMRIYRKFCYLNNVDFLDIRVDKADCYNYNIIFTYFPNNRQKRINYGQRTLRKFINFNDIL